MSRILKKSMLNTRIKNMVNIILCHHLRSNFENIQSILINLNIIDILLKYRLYKFFQELRKSKKSKFYIQKGKDSQDSCQYHKYHSFGHCYGGNSQQSILYRQWGMNKFYNCWWSKVHIVSCCYSRSNSCHCRMCCN